MIRNVARAAIVAAVLIGGTIAGVTPATSQAIPSPVPMGCLGADVSTQNLLDLIGPGQSWVGPPYQMPITFEITPTVPASMTVNEVGSASFNWSLDLPAPLVTQLLSLGTTFTLSATTFPVTISGGGSGGPITGNDGFSVDLTASPVVVPTVGPYTGPVTAGAAPGVIDYSAGQVTMTGTLLNAQQAVVATLNLVCSPTGASLVAQTSVGGAATTTSTATTTTLTTTTTTTAPPPAPVVVRPAFTG